jgi:hypothetical protein
MRSRKPKVTRLEWFMMAGVLMLSWLVDRFSQVGQIAFLISIAFLIAGVEAGKKPARKVVRKVKKPTPKEINFSHDHERMMEMIRKHKA